MSTRRFLRTLFRANRRTRSSNIGPRLFDTTADALHETGSAETALLHLQRNPTLWTLLSGPAKHLTPPRSARTRIAQFQDPVLALDFVALLLLPHSKFLMNFERSRRDATGEPAPILDQLAELDAAFGFSLWLVSEYITSLPPGSHRQVQFVERLRSLERSPLVGLFATEKYNLVSGSHAASGVREYLRERQYPPPLHAFLTATLDPLPHLSDQEACHALAMATALPPIDRWHIHQRVLLDLLARDSAASTQMRTSTVLPLLLANVPCVASANASTKCGHPPIKCELDPTTLERAIIGLLADGELPAIDSDAAKTLHALRQLANEGAAPGQLAVVDRAALGATGDSSGPQLAALTAQVAAFTERRAQTLHRAFALHTHPEVLRLVPDGNIGRWFRLSGEPPAIRPHIEEAMDAGLMGDHRRVLHITRSLDHTSTQAWSLRIDARLALGQHDEALADASQAMAAAPVLESRMPYAELCAGIPNEVSADLKQALYRTVVAGSAVRHGHADATSTRNDCFEDVLELSDVRVPSDAVPALTAAGVPDNVLVGFLAQICVPNIMDTVPVGRSTEELYEARIGVLNQLRQYDATNAALHESEIRDVATFAAVRREIASLDQQRVYVDVEGLASRLAAALAADFDRYKTYSKLDPRKNDSTALLGFIKEHFPEVAVLDMAELARALTSESDRAFIKLVYAVRSEFATGNEFGLDGYLSGGIRHGNLEAHLREPFAKKELLGTFRSDGEFVPPPLAQVLSSDAFGSASLTSPFERFASDFQSAVDEVNHEWVRVELADKSSKAIFDLTLTHADVRVLESLVRDQETVGDTISVMLQYWLDRVDSCLHGARERVNDELGPRMHAILSQLESDLRTTSAPGTLDPLIDNVIAPTRGALDTSVSKLAEWFQRSSVADDATVDPPVALSVSAATVATMYPSLDFEWSLNVDAPGLRLTRRGFKHWVDIIHALFTNAANHSGSAPSCRIEASLELTEAAASLVVKCPLGAQRKDSQVDSDIADAKRRLAHHDAMSAVREEGRSGLVKVLKYAQIDLRSRNATVDIRREGRTVVTEVLLPGPVAGHRRAS